MFRTLIQMSENLFEYWLGYIKYVIQEVPLKHFTLPLQLENWDYNGSYSLEMVISSAD